MEAKLTSPEALRLLRERAGLSQAQAARKLRIKSYSLVSMVERGHRKPTAKLALRIEKLFGIPASSWNVTNPAAENAEASAEPVAA